MTKQDTADFVRRMLKEIDARAPAACGKGSERMTLTDWRSACRDMSRMARAALAEIEGADNANQS